MNNQPCPCGSGRDFDQCCGPYLDGQASPSTAEALMRSRYTAYVQCQEDYLLQTWHSSTRPDSLGLSQQPPVKWLGLKVICSEAGREADDNGMVEFVARYKVTGKAERLHETSLFVKEHGSWVYLHAAE